MSATPKLRIGVVDDYPEAFGCFMNLPTNSCVRPGYEVEVFDSVARKILKWDYDFIVPKEKYGYRLNDSWYGLMGMVVRNEVDATAVTIRATDERLPVMDFSTFISYFQQVYIVKQPDQLNMSTVLLSPFTSYAWFSLLAVFIVCSFILACKDSLIVQERSFLGFISSFSTALWDTFGLALKQHECRSQQILRNFLARLVLFTVGLLIGTTYSSILASRLSVPLRSKLPFQSSEELAKLMLQKNFFLLSHSPGRRPVCWNCTLFEEALKVNPIVVEPNETKLVELLDTGKYAQWEIEDILAIPGDVKEDANNRIMIKDKSSWPVGVAFAFPKGSIYRKKFDEKLRQYLLFALTIKTRYGNLYFEFDPKNKAERIRMSVLHYREVLVLFASGCFIAFSSLCAEILFTKLSST